MKRMLLIASVIAVLGSAKALYAQTGCDDSPENPTIVLACVAGTGYLLQGAWRRRNRQ